MGGRGGETLCIKLRIGNEPPFPLNHMIKREGRRARREEGRRGDLMH